MYEGSIINLLLPLQVGNIEVAAVSSSVKAQAEAEVSETHWRQTIEVSSREAEDKQQHIQHLWKAALEHTVAEDMHRDLLLISGGCRLPATGVVQLASGIYSWDIKFSFVNLYYENFSFDIIG